MFMSISVRAVFFSFLRNRVNLFKARRYASLVDTLLLLLLSMMVSILVLTLSRDAPSLFRDETFHFLVYGLTPCTASVRVSVSTFLFFRSSPPFTLSFFFFSSYHTY